VAGVLSWDANWGWGIPLIILNVSLHVTALGFIYANIVKVVGLVKIRRGVISTFSVVMGIAALFVTVLHGIEATVWAGVYVLVGALPNGRSAMLYSVGAITSYGHANLFLAERWQVLGALEALNGMILFGLTTAMLYGMIQRAWPIINETNRASGSDDSAKTVRRPVR